MQDKKGSRGMKKETSKSSEIVIDKENGKTLLL